jgi:hypothetical protein
MTIPVVAFLYLYLLFVLVWLIFSLIALYHMIKYGQIGLVSILAVLVYLAVCLAILDLSYQYLSPIDWDAELTILRGGFQSFSPVNY